MKKTIPAIFLFLVLSSAFLAPISSVFAQEGTGVEGPAGVDGFVNSAAANGEITENYDERLIDCSLIKGGPHVVACFVWAFYYLVLYPSGKFAQVTADILDFFIAYSLDSNSYGSNGVSNSTSNQFIQKGWGIIRDIANVLFIFVLLYVAIRHILQLGSSDTKRLVISVIIAALLINFSMFFSKVIIDAGNILARAFYDNIEVVNPPPGEEGKKLTQALVTHISPQKLLSTNLFEAGNEAVQGQPIEKMPNGYAFFILAVAAFVNITIGLVFLSTFLLFAARTIGLWFMMIFSPIAFASFALPGGGNSFGQFGWNKWRDGIIELSFMAPIFLFFLFLAIMFLQIVTASSLNLDGNMSDTQRLMQTLIPFIVIIVILQQAKKISKDMAGQFGSTLTSAVGKIAGVAALAVGGVALGGAAMIARGSAGAVGSMVANSEKAKAKAAKSALYRNLIYKPLDKASKASMDLRNTGLGRRSGQLLNATLQEAGFGSWSAGKGTTKGGYAQRLEAYQKEKEEFANKLKVSDTAATVTEAREFDPVDGKVKVKLDQNGEPLKVKMSLQEAEIALLRKQNESKKAVRDHDIGYEVEEEVWQTINGVAQKVKVKNQKTFTVNEKDYDGLVKEKETIKEKLSRADADFAAVQRATKRDTNGNLIKDQAYQDAEKTVNEFKAQQKGLNDHIKRFEKENWGAEKEIFEAIEKQNLNTTSERMRAYSKSVKNEGLTAMYELARMNYGTASDARGAASGNIELQAEKVGKKVDSK